LWEREEAEGVVLIVDSFPCAGARDGVPGASDGYVDRWTVGNACVVEGKMPDGPDQRSAREREYAVKVEESMVKVSGESRESGESMRREEERGVREHWTVDRRPA
jgi:hypothetical protein